MFKDNSRQVKELLNQRANTAIVKIGELAKAVIVKNSPTDEGNLKRSIDYNKTIEGTKSKIEVGSSLAYAPYVEYGTGEFATNGMGRKGSWRYKDAQGLWHTTRGQKPSHFMRNSFEKVQPNVDSIIKKEFGDIK
ncbi:HK97-gp10 family putative phage morphogenesis protein [Leuconostoc citreum]|uniref:HK97-gp10 family putative phage morphogenesis protein n=1 Tax=Leuconostoc citreum TaxID=33964 RepID=UPI0032DEBBB3